MAQEKEYVPDRELLLMLLSEGGKRRRNDRVFLLLLILLVVSVLSVGQRANATTDPFAQMVQGPQDDGSTISGNPIVIGGKNGANAQYIKTDGANRLLVNSTGATPTLVYINPTASNGAVAVTLVAAVAAKQVFIQKLFIANTSTTVGHTVTIQSGTTTTRAVKFQLPVSSSFAWDGDIALTWGTVAGESLQVVIDAGGAAADVTVSGSTVQQ